MDWKDILVAVLLTIIGSVVIAYSTLYFQNWMAKKRLLKSLLAEVSHNVGVVNAQAQPIAGLKGIFAPAGLKELNNTSYLALRERGFLGDLPLEIQDKLLKAYDIIGGIIQGKFDHPAGTAILSPSTFTPSRTAISDLVTYLPRLESELAKHLGACKSGKHHTTTERRRDYNPVSLGTLYFGFALSLWSSKQISEWPVLAIAIVTTLVSLAFLVAVFSTPTLTFLNTRAVKILVPLTFVAFLYGFVIGWIQTFSQTSSVILQLIIYFGFAWIVTFLLVIINQVQQTYRRPVGILTAIALLTVGGIRLYHHSFIDYLAAGELAVMAVLVVLVTMGWLKVHGEFLE